MSDPSVLMARARVLSTAAFRCRTLADDIEMRRLLLAGRLDAVRARHTPAVWDSSAADASRQVLTGHIAPALSHLGVDLATTVRLLRTEGEDLAARSDRIISVATMLEMAELESTEASPQ